MQARACCPTPALRLAILRVPRRLRWPDSAKERFFAEHLALLLASIALAGAGCVALIAVDSLLFTGHVSVHINPRAIPFRFLMDVLDVRPDWSYVRDDLLAQT